MMQYYQEFITIMVIHLLGVASPGPDFAVVLRQSVSFGRRTGVMTSIGIGLGVLVHIAYCILGLGLVISQSIILFNLIKYLGAAYLVFIGIKALFSKPAVGNYNDEAAADLRPFGDFRALKLGFITNALNPKATIFFLSVFSLVISPNTPIALQAFYGVWMALITIIWFSGVSAFFSTTIVKAGFHRIGHWFERLMGAVLIALGLKIAFERAR